MSRHVLGCHFMFWDVMLCSGMFVMSCSWMFVMSCSWMLYHVLECYVVGCYVIYWDVMSCSGMLYNVLGFFNAHIYHTVTKLITLVNMLSRTAKQQWGLGYKALKTVYEGAVVPLLKYGAPIWKNAIRKSKNLIKYKRIRLMNIKIAIAYRTLSHMMPHV
jgi:hypothetical protein